MSDALYRAEAGVRAGPQDASARWLLFELLCVLAHWERALRQLQAWAGLSKAFDGTAHVLRGLIKAERQRVEVFAGRATPATVAAAGAQAPAWMADLAEALRLGAAGRGMGAEAIDASDAAREAGLSRVTDAGDMARLDLRACRFGPVASVTG